MGKLIRVRLDAETGIALKKLVAATGSTPSQIVRDALRLLASCHAPARERVAGLAKFSSGIGDLGSNKRRLKGFGE